MITLYAFAPGFGMPAGSPFIVKAMILLKMAGQRYGIELNQALEKAPKGKLPYLRDDDRVIADSEIIRRHLERDYGVDFDPGLSGAERAKGLALTRLAEDHLYFCTLYEHWQVDAHWQALKAMFFGDLPAAERDAVAGEVRKQVLRDLHGHGMGRHDHREMLDFARADFKAIADSLDDRPFLFGDTPTSADAAIGPQLQCIAGDPFDSKLTEALYAHDSLVAYAGRVQARFFPDFST
jgi:glutathione S-transferase